MQFTYREYKNKRQKLKYARRLRKRMTPQEKILWKELRSRKFHSIKFRRQVAIGSFIVDFLCVKQRLIIEIDGGIHHKQKEYDIYREEFLKSLGYSFIRFTNEDVDNKLSFVLKRLKRRLGVHPSPEPPDFA